MLYTLYQTNRALFSPAHAAIRVAGTLSKGQFGPFSHDGYAKRFDAAAEVIDGMLPRRSKPAWCINATAIEGRQVPVTRETLIEKPFCNLVRFSSANRER